MLIFHHEGGPMADFDLSIAAPYTPARLYYGPAKTALAGGMVLIGTDAMPPDPAWQNVVAYELDRGRSQLEPHPEHEGMEVGTAVYVHVP
jgi:hypothetical protein